MELALAELKIPKAWLAESFESAPRRPLGMSVARGCDLMGLPRSTYYDMPGIPADDTRIVARIEAVCDESKPTATVVSAQRSATGGSWSTPRRCDG